MTDEFIREVDEEYRRERVAQIWRRYGALILAGAFLLVGSVGGWRLWQHWELGRSEAASTRFEEAVRLARDNKGEEAEKAFAALAADAPAGYRLLARFRLAAEVGATDPLAGAKAYDTLADDGSVDGALRDFARLRAGALRIGTEQAAEGARALEGLATPTSPWRHSARELLGLAALKRGDLDAAGRWFDQIAADREAPQGLRSRLEVYSALVAGGVVPTTQ